MADQEIDIEGLQQALDQLQEKFGISDKTLSSFVKNIQKNSADFQKELGKLNKEVAKGAKGYKDQVDMLNKLDSAIEDLTDSMEDEQDATKKLAAEQTKAALLAQRDALQTSASMKGMQEATTKAASGMASAAVKGAGDFVKGLQSNATGVDLASGLMTAGIDVATAGTKALGQGLQAAAPMLMRFGPAGMVAAAALEIFGIVLDKSADSMNKLAKFGVEILQKEVEKTVKSFHEMNSAGAMFANGMNDMRRYSSMAGLTVEQFSGAVKNTAPLLAEAGYTVSDGAKMMANVTSQFARTTGRSGQTLQREMQNLGFGFQEQAELSAQIISDLRRTGTGGTTTNKAVAEATLDLAKNMRIVANITGEDAKQRMDQAKKQAEQYAFFSKVNEIARKTNDPGLPSRVKASLALMDETQRRAAIQATVLGGAVTDVGANLTGAADGGRVFADSLNSGGAQVVDMVGGFAQQGDRYLKATDEVGRAVSMAAIATGKNADLAAAFDSQGQQSLKLNSENLKKSIAQGDKAAGAAGGYQESLMAAEQAAQQLKIKMQEMMDVPIKKFADVSKAMLEGLQSIIDKTFGQSGNKAIDEAAERVLDEKKRRQEELEQLKKSDPKKYKQEAAKDEKKRTEGMKSSDEKYQQMINDSGPALYAEGGTIPAGETGIVGEAGPEIVKGPAEVTSAKESKEILGKLGNLSGGQLTSQAMNSMQAITSDAKESKEILGKLGNLSVGQLTSQAMNSMQAITSEGKGSIAGYFLEAAAALKWVGDKDNGSWTLGGEVVDQNTAREILDFARGWPKLKQEIQSELDKAKDLIGEGGSKLDASIKETGGSTKMSDYVTGLTESSAGAKMSDYATGFAKGGIASGSLSGYSATLHGTEAVVPLPDNKSIPVNLEGSAITGALRAQSDILNSILSAMQQNNKYASGLLQNSY
jgi:hypothetical protein